MKLFDAIALTNLARDLRTGMISVQKAAEVLDGYAARLTAEFEAEQKRAA